MPSLQLLPTLLLLTIAVRLSQADKVCIVGAGTIGSSFAAVFLVQGHDVVCCDAFVQADTLKSRITSIWPTLQLRGLVRKDKARRLLETCLEERLTLEPNMTQAVESVDLVQECVYEDVDLKQQVLQQLNELVDPNILIASSTSYVPLDMLTSKCKQGGGKDRIVIAHPSIPHWGSFMELCGTSETHVQAAKEWYTKTGFDCIVMRKTIFGHVWNSFLTLNLRHGESLIRQGVCTAQDVNTVLRHLGREFYARHLFLTLLIAVGGSDGLRGGLALRQRVGDTAIAILFASALPSWLPGSRAMGKVISHLIKGAVVPPPQAGWIDACSEYQEQMTEMGRIDVQSGMLEFCKEMYTRLPLEIHADPLERSWATKP